MKKVLLLITLFIPTLAFAQFKVGVEAGINASQMDWSDYFDTDGLKAGYQLGVTADYHFKNKWLLMSGLTFSQQSAAIKLNDYGYQTGMTDIVSASPRINYLTLPLSLGYDFRLPKNFHIIPSLGLYTAYGFSAGDCHEIIREYITEGNKSFGVPVDNNWNPFDNKSDIQIKHWTYGGRVGIRLQKNNLFTDLHFQHSLNNLNNNFKQNCLSLQFSIGFMIK